jgi:hypothetical protein
MVSMDRYLVVLREFVHSVGGDPTAVGPDTDLSYEHDGMLAHVLPHPAQESLVIDIEIMQLAEPAADPRNLERLLLLHQLNSVTRFSHGGSAFISLDQMLVFSRQLSVERLTGQMLAEAIADSLDHAASLRSAWDQLRELLAGTVRTGLGSERTTPDPVADRLGFGQRA